MRSILTTSLSAPKKEAAKAMKRRIMDHGNTDCEAIEEKRQHCSRQLIKMADTVSRLNKQRILMEQNGEKKIEMIRSAIQMNREKLVANNPPPEKLSAFDLQAEKTIEEEQLALAMVLNDMEIKTMMLSANIMIVEGIGLLTDCVSLREVIVDDDGKKQVVRNTVAGLTNDICVEIGEMRQAFDVAAAEENAANANSGKATEDFDGDDNSRTKLTPPGVKP